jgi:aspartate aminotransferase-like enzyme
LKPLPHFPNPYRLRLPGPVAVPQRVLQATALPMLNHRGPEFREIVAAVQERIRPVIGTQNSVMFFASSGTGVMEASLANVCGPGESVLVCSNGQFGERYASIARSLKLNVDDLMFEWGTPVLAEAVAERLRKKNYRAVVVVHNESSTGVIADLAAIGSVVRQTPSLLVVDSVSGLGGIPMRQDEWGVDVLVSASQKALMCPPGLAIVSASAKACVEIQKEHRCSRFYWDFRKALATSENNETPFTTPVSLMRGLLEALAMMHEEGLQNVLKRHHELASEFRKGAVALGFRIYGQPGSRSDTVVALRVPESVNGGDIVRRLYQEHHTVIAGSRNKLSGQVIRVGTMGAFDIDDVRTDLAFLKEALEYLDAPVETAVASTSSFELRSKVWQVK